MQGHGIERAGRTPMSVKSEGQRGAASAAPQTVSPPADDELEQRLAQLRDDISRGGRGGLERICFGCSTSEEAFYLAAG